MWEKSGKPDQKSENLNGKSEKHQHFIDSLFYNVDLITKIKNSLPLKANGLTKLSVGASLGILLVPCFWDELISLSGELVWGLRARDGGRLVAS